MHTKESLLWDLSAMDLEPTGAVFVHSSLKSVGPLENGADTYIDALMEYMKDGLLVLPAHTWDHVRIDTNPVMDILYTKTCVGVVPELFRKRPGVRRSLHPTHSVSAYGKDAEDYVSGDELLPTPCHRHSAYGKLLDRDATILLVGVDFTRNTYIHGVEEWCGIPGRLHEEPQDLYVIKEDGGRIHTPQYRHCAPLGSEPYWKVEPVMLQCRAMRMGKLGDADVMVVSAKKLYEKLAEMLKENPDLFSENEPLPGYPPKQTTAIKG